MKRTFKPLLFSLALTCWSAAFAADLYQEGRFHSLVGDVKAHRVGDILTVLVLENSSAASSADTNTKRDTDVGFNGVVDVGSNRHTGEIGAQINNDFTGGARTQRAGKLLAQITVTVVAVEPNGDLHITGEQLLEVNGERQTIQLEGKVRPQDISDANAVLSSRIADARIQYAGAGVLADTQRPGLITRVLTWLGL